MMLNFQPYMKQSFDGTLTESEREEMLTYIRGTEAIEKAQAVSDLYLQKAMDEINALPDGDAMLKRHSCKFLHFIGKRKY